MYNKINKIINKFSKLFRGSSPENNDQVLYEIIGEELASGEIRQGLMTRALAESGGNEPKARSLYIKYRIVQLIAEIKQFQVEKNQAEIEELIEYHEAFPIIIQKLRNANPEFDYLSLDAKKFEYFHFETAEDMYNEAFDAQYDTGNYQQAYTYYERIIKRFPHSPEAKKAEYEKAIMAQQKEANDEFSTRILCDDGNCIGIIGDDGKCTVCGKTKTGK